MTIDDALQQQPVGDAGFGPCWAGVGVAGGVGRSVRVARVAGGGGGEAAHGATGRQLWFAALWRRPLSPWPLGPLAPRCVHRGHSLTQTPPPAGAVPCCAVLCPAVLC
jgi:hypothetical protein